MKSTVNQTKRRIHSALSATLSPARIPLALDYIEYLRRQDEEMDATNEILSDKKLVREIRAVREDMKKNGKKNVTPWRGLQACV